MASSTCSKYCNGGTSHVESSRSVAVFIDTGWGKRTEQRESVYLSDQEVHVLLHEHIQLFLEDVLHVDLTLAAEVGRSLRHSAGNQGVALVGHLAGQIAGGLVDLGTLQRKSHFFHVS